MNSLSEIAKDLGLQVESEWPDGSIGYEWDAGDRIADWYSGMYPAIAASLHNKIGHARERMRQIQLEQLREHFGIDLR